MHPIDLIKRYGITDLTTEEEAVLTRELSAAYHMDEAAATNRDVQRIAEKVRVRLRTQTTEAEMGLQLEIDNS